MSMECEGEEGTQWIFPTHLTPPPPPLMTADGAGLCLRLCFLLVLCRCSTGSEVEAMVENSIWTHKGRAM